MARVWLIRHGESEANAGLLTGVPANIKLTPKGHQQAQQIAIAFPTAPALIVTSPFLRTKQTAQPTIERFANTPHREWQVQEFNYLADARRQNTTLAQRKPMADEYWLRGDVNYIDGDGAESFTQVMERINNLQAKIQYLDDEFIAIFTHGLLMRIFIWSLLANTTEFTAETMASVRSFLTSFQIPNGGILQLQTQPNSGDIWIGKIISSHVVEQKDSSTKNSNYRLQE